LLKTKSSKGKRIPLDPNVINNSQI